MSVNIKEDGQLKGLAGSNDLFGTKDEFEIAKQIDEIPVGTVYHVTNDYVEGGGSANVEVYKPAGEYLNDFVDYYNDMSAPSFKMGKIVNVHVLASPTKDITSTAGNFYNIFRLPEKWRPKENTYFEIKYSTSSFQNTTSRSTLMARVTTYGYVQVRATATKIPIANYIGECTFMIED